MPKVNAFYPCERVIIDANTNVASTINVIDSLQMSLPEKSDIDIKGRDVANVFRWFIFALLRRLPGEESVKGEIKIKLRYGHKKPLYSNVSPVNFEKPYYRFVAALNQIPVDNNELVLYLLYRELGEGPWKTLSRYVIEMELLDEIPAISSS